MWNIDQLGGSAGVFPTALTASDVARPPTWQPPPPGELPAAREFIILPQMPPYSLVQPIILQPIVPAIPREPEERAPLTSAVPRQQRSAIRANMGTLLTLGVAAIILLAPSEARRRKKQATRTPSLAGVAAYRPTGTERRRGRKLYYMYSKGSEKPRSIPKKHVHLYKRNSVTKGALYPLYAYSADHARQLIAAGQVKKLKPESWMSARTQSQLLHPSEYQKRHPVRKEAQGSGRG